MLLIFRSEHMFRSRDQSVKRERVFPDIQAWRCVSFTHTRSRYHSCERIHDYLYEQREIAVESDRKPLEAILMKPIYQAPLRLQSMILRFKPYSVNIKYIPGYHLVLAETFSRFP